MRMMRFPGLLAYAAMAMWLLHVMVTPAAAQPSAALVQSRLADHIDQFHAALMEKGASPDAHLTLASPNAAVALADGASLALESTTFNLATGRFLIRARGAEGSPLIAVVGVAATPVTVPVLARTIERNEDDRRGGHRLGRNDGRSPRPVCRRRERPHRQGRAPSASRRTAAPESRCSVARSDQARRDRDNRPRRTGPAPDAIGDRASQAAAPATSSLSAI